MKKINQYTRYGTVALALFQAYGLAVSLRRAISPTIRPLFPRGLRDHSVGGTMFLMRLGEQITARGVGNGISLIISSASWRKSRPTRAVSLGSPARSARR
ncbi:hypothetical protein [Celeribacter halophilus]|uniref:hypothetical protein n=1 Tax=Celeribacter halophilus TaxID=576117 RepID=UPI003A8D5898